MSERFPYPAHPRTPYDPLIVNAALTGMVAQRERFPAVPLTPAEIADDAQRCFEAGATIVHLHARDDQGRPEWCRDDQGRPEWRREAYAELVPEVRRRCPGIVVCATTSGREVADVDRRADVLLLDGDASPDMASLTLGSLNFHTGPSINAIATVEALTSRMAARAIMPELEIFDLGMAHLACRLLAAGRLAMPLYANVMLGFPNSAPAEARSLVALVDAPGRHDVGGRRPGRLPGAGQRARRRDRRARPHRPGGQPVARRRGHAARVQRPARRARGHAGERRRSADRDA